MTPEQFEMNQRGLEDLSNAIILQAVKDYRSALAGGSVNGRDSKTVIAECERFFQSEWFNSLTKIDCNYLMKNIRKEFEKEKRIES